MSTTLHERWGSRLSFILATTGAAVGLGNIWKFPYMAGSHGGSAFVLVYLVCVLIVGLPLMMAEMTLGRLGKHQPIQTIRLLCQRYQLSKSWTHLGTWSLLTLLGVLSFYSVVSGWSLYYLILSIKTHAFNHQTPQSIQALWGQYLHSPSKQLISHTSFMVLTMIVVAQGVKKGLERWTTWMLPLLFIILIGLVIFASHTPGFQQALHFLWSFQWSSITPDIALSALGHAFFSLAVGACCLLMYGSYLDDQVRLGPTILIIAGLDVLVACLAGLAIFPLVFTYHLPLAQGPGLMFTSLPLAFPSLQHGIWVAPLFFCLLLFAAWSSSISLAEPLVVYLTTAHDWNRRQASMLVGLSAWLIGACLSLSWSILHDFQWHQLPVFDLFANVCTNVMLPLGGLGITYFMAFCIPKQASESFLSPCWWRLWLGCLRTCTPLSIVLILLDNL